MTTLIPTNTIGQTLDAILGLGESDRSVVLRICRALSADQEDGAIDEPIPYRPTAKCVPAEPPGPADLLAQEKPASRKPRTAVAKKAERNAKDRERRAKAKGEAPATGGMECNGRKGGVACKGECFTVACKYGCGYCASRCKAHGFDRTAKQATWVHQTSCQAKTAPSVPAPTPAPALKAPSNGVESIRAKLIAARGKGGQVDAE